MKIRVNNVTSALVVAGALAMSTAAIAAQPSHLEHPHGAGTFMVEYQYMRMNMEGLRSGTEDKTTTEALAEGYESVPKTMSMDMHMFMPMYNFTHNLSVMLMMNYLSNSMEMTDHTMESSGLGDTEASINYKFLDDTLAVSLGLSIPTGSVSETMQGTMLMGGMLMDMEMALPYAMQLGSGTYDVTPSLLYLGAYYTLRYGAMVSYKYHIGENDQGYTLGDRSELMVWVRKPVAGVSLDAEITASNWGSIKGSNKDYDMTNTPPLRASNYGGTAIDAKVGAEVPVGPVSLGLDLGMPLYQDLNGLQMKRTWSAAASVSAMF